MRIGRWVTLGFLILLGVALAPEATAGCTCGWQNFQCAPECGSCATQAVSCTCTTDCGFGESCFGGYTEIERSICSIFFEVEVTCRRSGIQVLNQCATCDPGRYGPTCLACPGGADNPCNGHGACREGIDGDGFCNCFPGYAGQACQYSDAVTCNGHGRAQANGTCICDPAYSGATCNACAGDHYGYPTCTYCQAAVTCNGRGTCGPQGNCICQTGFAGPSCDTCAADYYGYPACTFCLASTTCNGHGVCDPAGACVCDTGYAGTGCAGCAPDYYGYPVCERCTTAEKCSGHGTCDANGDCVCEPGYGGVNCLACSPGAAELACSDLLDDDCDGITDCADTDCCSNLACAALDRDGDFFAGCDCDDSDPTVWATPGEARGLALTQDATGLTLLDWSAPSPPGGSSLTYETLRFDNAWDIDGVAFCMDPPDPSQPTNVESGSPQPGFAFYYLIRAVNGCPAGLGPLGTRSTGEPRLGSCP